MRESDYEVEGDNVSENQNDNIVDTEEQSEYAEEFNNVEEKDVSRHRLPFFSVSSSTDVLSFADEDLSFADEEPIRRRGFLPTLCRGVKRILNFCCCNRNHARRVPEENFIGE